MNRRPIDRDYGGPVDTDDHRAEPGRRPTPAPSPPPPSPPPASPAPDGAALPTMADLRSVSADLDGIDEVLARLDDATAPAADGD